MSSNSTFIEAVRSSKIKQPTQMHFRLKKWKESFRERTPYSQQDEALYLSGVWFSKKLNGIRKKLNEISGLPLKKETSLRLYIGLVNREYTVATEDMKNTVRSKGNFVFAGDLIERKSPIGPGGISINPEALIETTVSAIRYPISEIYNRTEQDNHKKIDDLEVLELLVQTSNLASHYDTYSNYWSECLWNDWEVQENELYDNIHPPASMKYAAQILSSHRIGNLLMELTWRSATLWNQMPKRLKDKFNNKKIVTKVNYKKGKKILKVGVGKSTQEPPMSFITEMAAEEIYWNELLLEPLLNLNGITIREILSVFRVLSSLGKIIQKTIPIDTTVKSINKLLQFSPTFQRKTIEIAIKQATRLPDDKIKSALDVLTFKKTPREDTWYTPIVSITDSILSFILPVLNSPNLIRSIEYWMKIGGIDLDKRGSLYEKKFNHQIKQHCKTTKYFNKAKIDNGSITLGATKEEIDFIFIFGNTVLIGEIKCSIFPASPIENYNFYKVIEGASEQAKRKSKFIKNNIKEFSNRYSDHTFSDTTAINIIPIVITNLHHGVGVPFNNIPVVDAYILENYFKGKQDFFVEADGQGSTKPNITKTFYSSLQEAESNILNYLKSPPVFSIMSKMIDKEIIPLLKMNNSEKNHGITRLYVNESKWLTNQ